MKILYAGPVSMLVLCSAELDSGIKFNKSIAEVRHLNQTSLQAIKFHKLCHAIMTLAWQEFRYDASAVPNKM